MVAESLITPDKQLIKKLQPPGVAMNRRDDSARAAQDTGRGGGRRAEDLPRQEQRGHPRP